MIPELNDTELLYQTSLEAIIENEINTTQHHAIPFSRFLSHVLYDPKYGYYTSGTGILGAQGDFVTAPELGDIFGNCLATKVASYQPSFPDGLSICEFGAGTGKLAVQLLNELSRLQIEVNNYSIVEVSPKLQALQLETINHGAPHFSDIVDWKTTLDSDVFNGVIIANEVIDAIPFELFEFSGSSFFQGYIEVSNSKLQLVFKNHHTVDFQRSIQNESLPKISSNFRSEIHCQAQAWLRTVLEYLKCGTLLIIDYGFPEHEYYHTDRSSGTMACHRRHYVHYDPLQYIGCQDISTHVEFSTLARVAEQSGAQLGGFTTLAGFLMDTGLTEQTIPENSKELVEFNREVQTLTSPSEMGDLFKVMELTKNLEPNSVGFEFIDHSHRL